MQKMYIFVPVINESKIDQGSLFNAFHKYPFFDETESYMILINIYFFHNQDLSVSIQNLQWSSFLIVISIDKKAHFWKKSATIHFLRYFVLSWRNHMRLPKKT